MNNKIKVSIIIPVYNTAKYLRQCLDSIKNQTLKEIEIICINDGSSDNSLEILNEYAENDNRFIILSQKNQGQSTARNTGLKAAKGEYIGFVDSDDYIDIAMFEKLYNNVKENDSEITMCSFYTYNDKTTYLNPSDRYMTLDLFPESFDNIVFSYKDTSKFLFRICVSPCNKIYKNSLFREYNIKFPEGLYFEDNVFFYEIYLQAKKISLIRDRLYYYRIISETSTVSGNEYNKLDFFEVFNRIEIFLKNQNLYEEYKDYFSTHKKNTLIYWYKKLNDDNVKKEYSKRFESLYNENISKHIETAQKEQATN